MYKVCIDPGHGGPQPGAVNKRTGTKEKDIALAVSLKVGRALEKYGVDVIYTRNSDRVIWPNDPIKDLGTRCKISDNVKADYFVSIHLNSAANENANGIETYCLALGGNGEELANNIQDELIKATGSMSRGVKTAKYYVLRNTNAPAVLTEIGFISNTNELNKLITANYQDEVAMAIARGILRKLNITWKEDKPQEFLVYGSKEEKFGPYLKPEYAQNKGQILKQAGYKNVYYIKPDGTKVPIE